MDKKDVVKEKYLTIKKIFQIVIEDCYRELLLLNKSKKKFIELTDRARIIEEADKTDINDVSKQNKAGELKNQFLITIRYLYEKSNSISQRNTIFKQIKDDFIETKNEIYPDIENYNDTWAGDPPIIDTYWYIKFCLNEIYSNSFVEFLSSEIELIGATPPKRKTKPTNETKLALTSNELMYLFTKLASEKLFISSDKIRLARGIESLCGHSVNKTRVKGQTMKLKELENIKKVIDNISAILQKDIEQGGI